MILKFLLEISFKQFFICFISYTFLIYILIDVFWLVLKLSDTYLSKQNFPVTMLKHLSIVFTRFRVKLNLCPPPNIITILYHIHFTCSLLFSVLIKSNFVSYSFRQEKCNLLHFFLRIDAIYDTFSEEA